jgi:hypothetical protein
MKKISIFFSMLAASLLMSALPAFSSGTGPFGGYGPDISHGMNPGVESQHIVFSSGTGPYGGYGPYGMEQSGESYQIANKDECLLVAKNCPPDMVFVQNRIDRLNAEIAKGTDVYTPGELKVLNGKLNDAYKELDHSNSGY